MSTYDASSQGGQHAAGPHAHVPPQDVTDAPHLPAGHDDDQPSDFYTQQHIPVSDTDDVPVLSTLEQLRANAAEEDDREPITVLNPKETIRLTLRTDLEQADVQRWSNIALDRKDRDKLRRRGGTPNLTRLNPVVMFAHAIAETCIQVEVLTRSGEWQAVADERTGEPLTFSDPTLRQVLGGIDVVSAVKRAFNGSEPALMEAGRHLIDASGFGDDVGDDEDPTTAVG